MTYHIYVDEAGTSALEPNSIVAAFIVQEGLQKVLACIFLEIAKDKFVPAEIRDDFIFHGTEIFSGNKYSGVAWDVDNRKQLIQSVASIPRMIGATISFGISRRGVLDSSTYGKMKPEHFDHCMAFWKCLSKANQYFQDYHSPDESVFLWVEDLPKVKQYLNKVLTAVPPDLNYEEHLIPSKEEIETGIRIQRPPGRIDRFNHIPNYLPKNSDPCLEIADALAFVLNRYFKNLSGGYELHEAIFGHPLVWEDWQGPGSSSYNAFNHFKR